MENATATEVTELKRTPVVDDPRKLIKVETTETFNIDLGFEMDAKKQPKLDAAGQKIPAKRTVDAYSMPGVNTPKIDKDYVFPAEATRAFLLGMALKDNILINGPTGVGKTSLVEQICARLNYNFIRINFDGCTTRSDLVGETVIHGRETKFMHGILPRAFEAPGTIILFDEWDTISGECAFVLQRPLERNDKKLLIMENGGELVQLHPENILVACANTLGQGDETGLYSQGTKVQNYSQINRFSMTIRLGYLPADQEKAMLKNKFPMLADKELDFFVGIVQKARESYDKNELMAPLSPRDLINWVEKWRRMADPMQAAKFAFLNRCHPKDSETLIGLISRLIPSK